MDLLKLLISTCVRSVFVLRDRDPHVRNSFGFTPSHGGMVPNDPLIEGIHDMQTHDRGSDINKITLSIRITRDGICTFCPLEQLEFSCIHIGCVAHAALCSYNQPTL